MNERPTRPIRPGGQLSASEFNRAAARNDGLSDFSGTGIGSSDEFGQIILNSTLPPQINIRILSGTNPYAWEEVYLKEDGTWEATGARSGTATMFPAYERMETTTVPANTVAEAVFDAGPDGGGRWLFSVGGSGGVLANAFGVIEVSGQSNVEADIPNDTFTLANGTGIAITTNGATKVITISRTSCGYSGVSGFDAGLLNILTVAADGCLEIVHPAECVVPVFLDAGTIP